MMTISRKETPKNAKRFYCKNCDFGCSKKSDYTRHLLTSKHTMVTEMVTNISEKTPKNVRYYCECGKSYKHRQNLYVHRKRSCTYTEEQTDPIKKDSDKLEFCKELFPYIKDMMVEMMPKMQPTTINTTNNNNQIYNINMFLNEQCKDAMNMSDFIESIQLSIQDIERIGSEGQTTGMANILIDKLNTMDVFQRPMHCSDAKKETIYIKDEDKWEIEKKDRPKLKHVLKRISNKSVNCLHDVAHTENFEQTCIEVLKEPIEDKKIISKVAKNVVLNEESSGTKKNLA